MKNLIIKIKQMLGQAAVQADCCLAAQENDAVPVTRIAAEALVCVMEKAVLMSRRYLAKLPPSPKTEGDRYTVAGCSAEATDFGYRITMPALLPARTGDSRYVRQCIGDACAEKCKWEDDGCVVVFEQIYDDQKYLRRWRDHDNTELAGVLNELNKSNSMASTNALIYRLISRTAGA